MASRRDFLKLLAVAGAASGTTLAGLHFNNQPIKVTETRLLMGTIVNLTVVGGSESEARQVVNRCLNRMADLEAVFSRFNPDSALSKLNNEGCLINPPGELVEVLYTAESISLVTDGAYDVTVKPLYDVYRGSSMEGELPPNEAVAAAQHLVDHSRLQISETVISFGVSGMAVTLDSIAKGYIIDRGVSILKDNGYTNVLVEAGGDLMASGTDGVDDNWQIGVMSPRNGSSKLYGKFGVVDRAVASSGDYFQYFSPDMKNHHIIDPRTGYSSPDLSGATVFAPNCMEADGFSTALMVISPNEGIELIESQPGFEAVLFTKDLQALRTSGLS